MSGIEGMGAMSPGLMASQGKKDPENIEEAAREFESLFLNQLLKSMRKTVEKSELFHGGNAEDIYTEMLDSELSRELASSGGIGLADMLIRQLTAGGEAPGEDAPGPVVSPLEVKKSYGK